VPAPDIPDDVQFSDLDRAVRARLRTLSKDNAEQVGLHLVMTGRLIDSDPELAYEHAQAAVRRAGRVDVAREAAGLAAYRTGRFAEALRELRTVRRLNGSSEHLAIMADCERGLGRPERALALATSDEAASLDPVAQVELAMVVSGARLDLGEPEAALAVLSTGAPTRVGADERVVAARVAQARAAALDALGRHDEAASELAAFSAADLAAASGEVDDDVVVFDLADDEDAEEDDVVGARSDGRDAVGDTAGAEPGEEGVDAKAAGESVDAPAGSAADADVTDADVTDADRGDADPVAEGTVLVAVGIDDTHADRVERDADDEVVSEAGPAGDPAGAGASGDEERA